MSNGITGNMQAALFHCGRIKRTDLRLGMAWNYVLSGGHSGHWNWSSCFGHLIPDGTGFGNWRKIYYKKTGTRYCVRKRQDIFAG